MKVGEIWLHKNKSEEVEISSLWIYNGFEQVSFKYFKSNHPDIVYALDRNHFLQCFRKQYENR